MDFKADGCTCSRRAFITGSFATGALSAFAITSCAPKGLGEKQSGTAKAGSASDITWNDETDVLVVGSGYAGLAAAYEAAKAGADVRIIEKHSTPGGNSIFSDGQIAVVGSTAQKDRGIEDSVETFMADALKAGLNLNYKDKLRIIGEQSNDAFEWTINEIGVKWAQDPSTGGTQLISQGGHTVLRCIPPQENSGSGIVNPLIDKLSELGVKVETKAQLIALVKDDDGRIVGGQIAIG
ncbi:FAD-dependent oxidoreductase, partial [Slackia exigua]